ncbi:DUF4190 domain-containing protein [Actinomadura formosensis]|uniref:DUF4190 domain-containing protein n=1 Tax=Actinomadura formosensis TaxID=60706 RepID=UPI00082C13AA|nr:DUF4190 domain-containing protein [Actinomadura formosensis]
MSEQQGREVRPEDRPDGRPAGQPPAGPRTRQTGLRALWLGGTALLTVFFFYPLSLVLGVAALVAGVKARREARQARDVAPGAVQGMVLGAVGLGLSLAAVTTTAVLWTEWSGYQKCVSTANTHLDKQSCRDEYYPKIEKKLDLPAGTMDKYGILL